jgi:hypothetical protein
VTLALQLLLLLHQAQVVLAFPLDLPLVLLQSFLLPDQLFALPVQFFPLPFRGRDVAVSETDGRHVLLDHPADAVRLLGVVLLQPPADDVEQLLHNIDLTYSDNPGHNR